MQLDAVWGNAALPVNALVARQYEKRAKVDAAEADCSYIETKRDKFQFWVCDMVLPVDTCSVDVRRLGAGKITARILGCSD